MNDTNDEIGPVEFEATVTEITPPDFLEHQVLGALKNARLIRSRWSAWQRQLIIASGGIAAAALLVMTGAAIGARWSGQPTPQYQPEFMLVLRNSPREMPIRSDDDELQRAKEYGAWARKMNKEGRLIDGEKLTNDVRLLDLIDGHSVVSEGEPSNRDTAIAGYFLIRARNYQQAIEMAQECPHVKYGGTIEIRQIDLFGAQPN